MDKLSSDVHDFYGKVEKLASKKKETAPKKSALKEKRAEKVKVKEVKKNAKKGV